MGLFFVSAISMAVIAILIILQEGGWGIPSWLLVFSIIITVTMYGGGISSLPYIIVTEMFSFQVSKLIRLVIFFFYLKQFISFFFDRFEPKSWAW